MSLRLLAAEQAHTYTVLKLPVLQYSACQLHAQIQHLRGRIDEPQVAHCTPPHTQVHLAKLRMQQVPAQDSTDVMSAHGHCDDSKCKMESMS